LADKLLAYDVESYKALLKTLNSLFIPSLNSMQNKSFVLYFHLHTYKESAVFQHFT